MNDNTSDVTIALLKANKVPLTDSFLASELRSHPYYPSLASVSDTLNLYKIDNEALRINAEDLSTLSSPFIAHLNIRRGSFALVEKVTSEDIMLTFDGKTYKKLIISDFLKIWDNIVLTANATGTSVEPDYSAHHKTDIFRQLKMPLFILTIFLLIILSLLSGNLATHTIPLFVTKIIGLFFIGLLIKHELGLQSDITDKLCTMSKSAGCNEVLKSKASNLFGFIKLADIGLVWFSSSFLFLFFFDVINTSYTYLPVLGWFSVFSIPFIIFSVSYQAIVVKKYCPLCIGVMAMLATETILLFTLYHFSFEFPSLSSILLLTSIASLVAFAWIVIHPQLMSFERLSNLQSQYLRLKRNSGVILSLLAEEQEFPVQKIPYPIRITDSEMGNDNLITEVINLYCTPCKESFEKVIQFISRTNGQCPAIQFSLFANAENKDNPMTRTAAHVLALTEKNHPSQVMLALQDWFLINDYNEWSIKYPVKLTDDHFDQLKQQAKWHTDNKIEGTPTIFFNNKKLPYFLDLIDLQYFD